MSLHTRLLEHIQRDYGDRLPSPPVLTQDALSITLDNGVTLIVRYAAADAYSLRWHTGAADTGCGIDTAPLHTGLASFPNHLHRADGSVVADPLTRPDAAPEANLAAVIEALLGEPPMADLRP